MTLRSCTQRFLFYVMLQKPWPTYSRKLKYVREDVASPFDNLGSIYGITKGKPQEGPHLSGKVVFNMNDAVRSNGYVTQVCIALTQTNHDEKQSEMTPDLTLYVISRTMDSESFQIVHQRPIFQENVRIISNLQRIIVPDSTVYLESGQFLAVGFGKKYANLPSYVNDHGSAYSLDLDTVSKAHTSNTIITFDEISNGCVAISFRLVPTSGENSIECMFDDDDYCGNSLDPICPLLREWATISSMQGLKTVQHGYWLLCWFRPLHQRKNHISFWSRGLENWGYFFLLEFIRDVFLWSVFLGHYNLAACLCSHSPVVVSCSVDTEFEFICGNRMQVLLVS